MRTLVQNLRPLKAHKPGPAVASTKSQREMSMTEKNTSPERRKKAAWKPRQNSPQANPHSPSLPGAGRPGGGLEGASGYPAPQAQHLIPARVLQKPKGREHLRRLLNWEEFDELRDARRGILLDTIYDSVIFAVGKGFPWVEVVQVVKFTEELLKETKGMGTQAGGAREPPGRRPRAPGKPGPSSFLPLAFGSSPAVQALPWLQASQPSRQPCPC